MNLKVRKDSWMVKEADWVGMGADGKRTLKGILLRNNPKKRRVGGGWANSGGYLPLMSE